MSFTKSGIVLTRQGCNAIFRRPWGGFDVRSQKICTKADTQPCPVSTAQLLICK